MSNNSATGGYLQPAALPLFPGSLTFQQFLQTVFVGVSALDGEFVRPRWQKNPPKAPDVDVNWLAIGVTQSRGDANAWVGSASDGTNITQRHEELDVQCAFYGPDAYENSTLVRDGFQIQQNLEALRSGKMGFVSTSQAIQVPDLVNERWRDKFEMTVTLRREIQRVYPIVTLVSASGVIHTVVGNEAYLLDWNSNA